MFGYVTINKAELKVKDFERYRAFYCGLCYMLKKRHGRSGQMTLTYDMTFLIILLTSLYEEKPVIEQHRCIVHPTRRHKILYNEITKYAADMNILLTYEHFLDDWRDEKKLSGRLGSMVFRRKYKKIMRKYKRQCNVIRTSLSTLTEYEKASDEKTLVDVDAICRPFGELMAELMIYREDAFSPTLRKIGFYLGKFIYLMDARMDLENDRKKECFNPFLTKSKEEDFEEWAEQVMLWMIAEAAREFEKLPLEWDVEILRNILYDGVWSQYRKEEKKDE